MARKNERVILDATLSRESSFLGHWQRGGLIEKRFLLPTVRQLRNSPSQEGKDCEQLLILKLPEEAIVRIAGELERLGGQILNEALQSGMPYRSSRRCGLYLVFRPISHSVIRALEKSDS